tara:strand:- start:551 stop:715 length:165 start_codon:yes stop_codon:yes gene_type:complete
MGNLPTSLPVTPAYAMVARSKSPLDFNAKAAPPDPSASESQVTEITQLNFRLDS